MSNHGAIWWTELMTRDTAASKAYYETVCGWTFTDLPMPEGVYHLASRDGQQVAGIMDMSNMPHLANVPSHWFTYIAVDDMEVALKATEAAGGKILRPPFDIPDIGRIAIITDPTGAALGLMTPPSNS